MKIYLSIDYDYWGFTSHQKDIEFLYQTLSLNVPKVAMINHYSMIDHIDSIPHDRLINVDYHSDLPFSYRGGLSDGSWPWGLRYDPNRVYEWRHPFFRYRKGLVGDVDFYTNHDNFKKVARKRGISNIDLNDVVGVGFCLSPEYILEESIYPLLKVDTPKFLKFIKKYIRRWKSSGSDWTLFWDFEGERFKEAIVL